MQHRNIFARLRLKLNSGGGWSLATAPCDGSCNYGPRTQTTATNEKLYNCRVLYAVAERASNTMMLPLLLLLCVASCSASRMQECE